MNSLPGLWSATLGSDDQISERSEFQRGLGLVRMTDDVLKKIEARPLAIGVRVPSEAITFYPIESLSWLKILFVRLFAAGRFKAQRNAALRSYKESLHSCFVELLSKVQNGRDGYDELNTFVFLLRDLDRFYSPKRRFLMGAENILSSKREAEKLYVPAIQSALCSSEVRRETTTLFFRAVNRRLSKSVVRGDLDEDAVKRS
jgi:hypothetical protein